MQNMNSSLTYPSEEIHLNWQLTSRAKKNCCHFPWMGGMLKI